jgi:vancomycin permeability regulator SanA
MNLKNYLFLVVLGHNLENQKEVEHFLHTRLKLAAKVYHKLKPFFNVKFFLSGGDPNKWGQQYSESAYMANYLVTEYNIPPNTITGESNSLNTQQNAEETYNWIQQHTTCPIIMVITSEWHMPRTKKIFNNVFKNHCIQYLSSKSTSNVLMRIQEIKERSNFGFTNIISDVLQYLGIIQEPIDHDYQKASDQIPLKPGVLYQVGSNIIQLKEFTPNKKFVIYYMLKDDCLKGYILDTILFHNHITSPIQIIEKNDYQICQ